MPTFTSFVTAVDNFSQTSTATNPSNVIGSSDGSFANIVDNVKVYAYFGGYPTGSTRISSLSLDITGKLAAGASGDGFLRILNSSGLAIRTVGRYTFTSESTQTLTITFGADDITPINEAGGINNVDFEFGAPGTGAGDHDIDSIEITAQYVEANATWTSWVSTVDPTFGGDPAFPGAANVIGAADGTWTTNAVADGSASLHIRYAGFPSVESNIVNISLEGTFRKDSSGGTDPGAPAIRDLTVATDATTSGGILNNPDILATDTSNITSTTGETRTFNITEGYLDNIILQGLDGVFFRLEIDAITGGNPGNRRTTQIDAVQITVNYFEEATGPDSNSKARVMFIGI